MANIDSLPPESLHRILELVAEPDPKDYYGTQVAGRKALAAASLVARKWREPAQALMWLQLDFYNWKATVPILASPVCGKFHTAGLTMDPSDFEDGVGAGGVIGRLKGLEDLAVWSYHDGGIDASWLNFESLADLKTLYIAALFSKDTVPAEIHPAFQLHTLEFAHLDSAAIIRGVFAASASSLLSLTLNLHYTIPSLLSGILASLPLVSNQLEHLNLKSFTLVPGLGAVLSTFSALTSLSLEINNLQCLIHTDEFLSHFAPAVKGLSLRLNFWIAPGGDHAGLDVEDFGDAVLARLGKREMWEGLVMVETRDAQEELEGDVRGNEILRRCAEKGIGVRPLVAVHRSWQEEVEEE